VINLLHQLDEIGITSIYVALDGPKNEFVEELQEQLIKYLDSLPTDRRAGIRLWQREKNLGVAVSVISAIDWFFSHVESGAILEDDLIIDNSFFPYLMSMLERFRCDSEVTLVSGNSIPGSPTHTHSLEFTNYPQTWGWGTWRDRWTKIRLSAYNQSNSQVMPSISPVKNFWSYGVKRVLSGKVDTWDIPLARYMVTTGTYSVLPPVNLVSNVGNDNFATHTLEKGGALSRPIVRLSYIPEAEISVMKERVEVNNALLEKKVFQIKWWHGLLPLYSHLDLWRKELLKLATLEQRLGQVKIPR
jgi:hypothetical protein